MKPGSLRIVGKHKKTGKRVVQKFEPGKAEEDDFYDVLEAWTHDGFHVWVYEMTDKGWTEF